MRISLIDDDPICLSNYKLELEAAGHIVETYLEADDVVNNLNKICNSTVLIILDLMMQLGTIISQDESEETGMAIYNRIRKIDKDIPVVILSARDKAHIWPKFSDKNTKEKIVTKYLQKPIGPGVLPDFVEGMKNA